MMQAYKNFFYNSEKFFLLRTTGRLAGILVWVIIAVKLNPVLGLLPGLITSFIVDVYLFRVKGLKESSFKDPELIERVYGVTPEQYDNYASAITWARPLTLTFSLIILFCIFSDRSSLDQKLLTSIVGAPVFYLPIMIFFVMNFFFKKYGLSITNSFYGNASYFNSRTSNALNTMNWDSSKSFMENHRNQAMNMETTHTPSFSSSSTVTSSDIAGTCNPGDINHGVPGFNTAGIYTGSSSSIGGISN